MFLRYLIVSALVLGVDIGSLALLVAATEVEQSLAAGGGYLAGAVVHYALSSRYVFERGWLSHTRWAEFGAFVASGVVGFLMTVLVVRVLTENLDLPLAPAKTVAVVGSFVTVYALRRILVFRVARVTSRGA